MPSNGRFFLIAGKSAPDRPARMTGYERDLILLGLFFAVAINEDSAVVSGALLSCNHVFPPWQPFLACFLGMWLSDFAIYAICLFGGRQVLQSRFMRSLIAPEKVAVASRWFERYGGFAVVFSRFVLGTRTALLVVSGLLKYPVQRFLTVTFAGAIGWLLLVYLLFAMLGNAATAVFGMRWVTALAMVLFSGAASAMIASRLRKDNSDPRSADQGSV
jgi:membrane protein DedA with SNARE-associated domain